jgi:hypothetical protein
MGTSVGLVEIKAAEIRRSRWVVGAAPGALPFLWLEDDDATRVGRFVQLFPDDESARRRLGELVDDEYEPTNGHGSLRNYIVRLVRDLTVTERASIARVEDSSDVTEWMREVLDRRTTSMPDEFLDADADLLLLPSGRSPLFAIVRETAVPGAIRCGNPRPLPLA